ncbi:helix-turn-helix transcriptional regulator [Bacteroides acidifaciens]|uniref:XRE family transcriptional regulator n=1 Tax=Bacteroides acidifaciens TaxID=85831 RepID=A0A4S2B1X6_9BACE|nr:helix-turn-helix transcriptional regulator [Bacteroides acidifaciens]TGY07502.1 XRE family transcriptional regulator [Bacteroides acidifaciens]
MELYERIISKDEINSRAVDALLAIIANGLVATKTDLAECLGAKPAKFSEILNYRMKVGIDMVAKVCDRYGVDPYWVLMGRGNHIFRDPDYEPEPYYIEDDNDLDRQYHTSKEDIKGKRLAKVSVNELKEQAANPQITGLAELFYNKTLEQAEEIGKLKAQIKELEQRLGKNAADANTSTTANAG